MRISTISFLLLIGLTAWIGCGENNQTEPETEPTSEIQETAKIPVIFDTDANNELDDQHALAYLLFNGETFDVKGITVNATRSGGGIDDQYAEAERVLKLCTLDGKIPLYHGADADFETIRENVGKTDFDGHKAVDFIISEAKKDHGQKLVLLPVGKLTNIALALEKAPEIKDRVRIVWLGSNYPDMGEYNLENDIPSLNYVLEQEVPFEMVTVRYGKPSGTGAVKASLQEIEGKMPGLGPESQPVVGRHGESFTHFGDYSINLFNHIKLDGDSRSLFDMAAVAIVKNPQWAETFEAKAPLLTEDGWVERPESDRSVIIWENFNKEGILADFYSVMQNPVLVK